MIGRERIEIIGIPALKRTRFHARERNWLTETRLFRAPFQRHASLNSSSPAFFRLINQPRETSRVWREFRDSNFKFSFELYVLYSSPLRIEGSFEARLAIDYRVAPLGSTLIAII